MQQKLDAKICLGTKIALIIAMVSFVLFHADDCLGNPFLELRIRHKFLDILHHLVEGSGSLLEDRLSLIDINFGRLHRRHRHRRHRRKFPGRQQVPSLLHHGEMRVQRPHHAETTVQFILGVSQQTQSKIGVSTSFMIL